jgi:hypothetical protein
MCTISMVNGVVMITSGLDTADTIVSNRNGHGHADTMNPPLMFESNDTWNALYEVPTFSCNNYTRSSTGWEGPYLPTKMQ